MNDVAPVGSFVRCLPEHKFTHHGFTIDSSVELKVIMAIPGDGEVRVRYYRDGGDIVSEAWLPLHAIEPIITRESTHKVDDS